MKKTLFPLILISLTFVISSISVIADITTFGRLNTFNHFFAILMLVSLALIIYSLRIKMHYIGSLLLFSIAGFIRLLSLTNSFQGSNTALYVLAMLSSIAFLDIAFLIIHHLMIKFKFMNIISFIFSLISIVLLIAFGIYYFISFKDALGDFSILMNGVVIFSLISLPIILLTNSPLRVDNKKVNS